MPDLICHRGFVVTLAVTGGVMRYMAEQVAYSLLQAGRKVAAISTYRQMTGCSLREAKDEIENISLAPPEGAPNWNYGAFPALLEAGRNISACSAENTGQKGMKMKDLYPRPWTYYETGSGCGQVFDANQQTFIELIPREPAKLMLGAVNSQERLVESLRDVLGNQSEAKCTCYDDHQPAFTGHCPDCKARALLAELEKGE